MSSLRIMVVDDSALTAKKLQKILEEAGHRIVSLCTTGRGAVDAYATVRPDIVTMDIAMPDMNGIDASRAILAQAPEAIIIMVTAHGQEQMVVEAIDAGAKGYLLKPIRPEIFCETIERVYKKYATDLRP
jgi:two-component system chemotaxis response regulator CheY